MSVAAGVVGAANQSAVAALLDVPSERRRSANLDRGHDPSLDPAEMSAMAATERFAVAAEDIRYLWRGTHRPVSGGGVTSRRSRSSGLEVLRMVLVATWA
jgi:hypothetical protein